MDTTVQNVQCPFIPAERAQTTSTVPNPIPFLVRVSGVAEVVVQRTFQHPGGFLVAMVNVGGSSPNSPFMHLRHSGTRHAFRAYPNLSRAPWHLCGIIGQWNNQVCRRRTSTHSSITRAPVIASSTSRAGLLVTTQATEPSPDNGTSKYLYPKSGYLTNRDTWIGRQRPSVRVFKFASSMSERKPHFNISQCKLGCKPWRKPAIF